MTDDVLDERTFRPVRLSSWLATLLALAAVAVLTVGEPRLRTFTAAGIVAGAFSALAIGLSAREGAVTRTIGTACLPVAGLALVGVAAFALVTGSGLLDVGYTLGIYTAALGGGLSVAGLDRGPAPVAAAKRAGLLTLLVLAVAGVGFALGRPAAIAAVTAIVHTVFDRLLSFLLAPPESGASAMVFFLLLAAAVGLAARAAIQLVAHGRDLLTREQRDVADRLTDRLQFVSKSVVPMLVAFGVLAAIALLAGAFDLLPGPLPSILRALFFAPALRTATVAVGVVGFAVWFGVRVLVVFRRLSAEYLLRTLAPLVGGIAGVGGLVVGSATIGVGSTVDSVLQSTPLAALSQTVGTPLVVLTAIALALFVFTLWVGLLLTLRAFRFLPARAPGMTLVAGGVLLATVVDPPGLVLAAAGVAATLVVWDTGVLATELGDAVGRHSRTQLGELVHVGGSAAVAAVSVGAVLLVDTVANTIRPDVAPETALVGLLAGLVGTFAVLAVVRG